VRVRAVGAGGIKRSNPFVYGGAGWEHAEY
jgi:hypothetical protein